MVTVLLPVHLYQHDWTLLILPGWILAVYATRGSWDQKDSRFWFVILWSGFFLAPLGFIAPAWLSVAVVSNVLLLILAIIALSWRLASTFRRLPEAMKHPVDRVGDIA
jgi:hypothetical protein